MGGTLPWLSHAIAAGSYAVLAGLLMLLGSGPVRRWLSVAAAVTALWAGMMAYGLAQPGGWLPYAMMLGDTLRSAVWLLFIAIAMHRGWAGRDTDPSRRVVALALAIVALQLLVDAALAFGFGPEAMLGFVSGFGRVALAVGGLVLTHNLFVNSAPANRWSLNLLVIALAGLFAYDLNVHTLRLLDPALAKDFFAVRGLAYALLTPLFLVAVLRNRSLRLQLSRQAAFQTFSLGAIGMYLVLMSLAAYLLGLLGGDWGRLLRIVLVFGGLVAAAMLIFSGSARAWLRVKINKHFLAYRYDYREEWLRFIAKVSRTGPGFGELRERVVEAMAGIVDSPGGALYVRDAEGMFQPAAKWNFRAHRLRRFRLPPAVVEALANDRIVELGARAGADMPPHLSDGNARLMVPLSHVDELIALAVLEEPLAARELDWEDYDILRIVGRQGASYIAEARALADLEESRKFEEFNRRFAFIMHDIKNVVSQLSLLARNAQKHADNPAFRADMVATLTASAGKMNDMLARLAHESSQEARAERFDVHALLSQLVEERRRAGAAIELDADGYALEIPGDRAKIEQAITHLLQNAIDAGGTASSVVLRLRNEADGAKLIIEDRGCGMSDAFIRDELFKPFRSTKADGFGIGAYEAREIVRAQGGRLTVDSEEGVGTRFILSLRTDAAKAERERR